MSLSHDALRRALSIRDLTLPEDGRHAIQLLVEHIAHAVADELAVPLRIRRASPIVPIADNYDRLGYAKDAIARDARYARYVCEGVMLRSQTSAMIPPLLPGSVDVLLACPGIVYRRDSVDRLHTGEPHQLDLWCLRSAELQESDLLRMIARVVSAALPGRAHRVTPAEHPYTTSGLQIDVREGDAWIEIGECGLAARQLLDANVHGLAMGLGLDRLLMLRKAIPDIRLLRAADPRISSQMLDLSPYRDVSRMPPVRRDLSIVRDEATVEDLGDEARSVLGDRSILIESLEIASETPYEALPVAARARLGIAPTQTNYLVRLVLRAIDRTLTHEECNVLRDDVYDAIHRGSVRVYASR